MESNDGNGERVFFSFLGKLIHAQEENDLPRVLIIGTYRSEESAGKQLLISTLSEISDACRESSTSAWLRIIDVQPLGVSSITELIQSSTRYALSDIRYVSSD